MSKSGLPPRVTVATQAAKPARSALARPRVVQRRHGAASAWFIASLLLLDAFMIVLALLLAYWSPVRIPRTDGAPEIVAWQGLAMLLITPGIVLVAFALGGLYAHGRRVSRFDQLFKICTHLSFSLILALAINTVAFSGNALAARRMIVLGWLLSLSLVVAGRLAHDHLVGRLRAYGLGVERLLIVGTGATAETVFDKVRHNPALGYDLIGFVDHPGIHRVTPRELRGMPVYGTTARLAEVVRRHEIDELILAVEGVDRQELVDLVSGVRDLPVEIKVFPDTFRLIVNGKLNISDLDGLPMITVRTGRALRGAKPVSRAIKRGIDLIVAILTLTLLAPLMLVLACLVKLDSPGPILYVQERVGRDGVLFNLLKFRSMTVDAEARTGPVFASRHDPRVTRVGRLLRRFSLDELPQFINVIRGEMSIVGPRPERPHFVRQFSQVIPRYMERHAEKAGITGWAQVNGLRGQTSIEERTRYDLYYVEHWSVLLDLKIMLKTLLRVFHDDNAY